MRDWEADYTDFVTVYAGRLRRLAYVRCGDWDTADRLTRRVLLAVYRRGNSPHQDPPEVYAERALLGLLGARTGPQDAGDGSDVLAPPVPFHSDELLAAGRARRRVVRAVTAAVTVIGVVAAGAALMLLRPVPGGTPVPEAEDCMAGLPSTSAPPSPSVLSPTGTPSPGPADDAGMDRLTALTGDLPLRGATVMPEQVRRERLSCEVGAYFRSKVNPAGLERIDLGLDGRGDERPLAALLDPAIGPAALTVSVRVATASGQGTVTISAAPTVAVPDQRHCARLAICRLSTVTEDGLVIEQYGVHDTPEAQAAGHRLGADADWWSVAVYTGHSMVLVTITNTLDVRAALPASTQYTPLGEQVTALAADPRLAVFDPPASATPTDPATSR
ncbi:hypothetical protein Cme02nite_05190 [Catellatospora methionotrophica]|uniref:Uncharacterized protein n=1 Tax=Catellatospora methionotrophica TaxID=121620 RepID=A0A8J3L4W9_9ACTN|nr:hypothetical protein [Catellatospora methionotrophica]GIG12187.1 hypothetical protein Cme02nite_05190 [Catellatospora methionotrophica]